MGTYSNSPRLSGSLPDTERISLSPIQFAKTTDKSEFGYFFSIKYEKSSTIYLGPNKKKKNWLFFSRMVVLIIIMIIMGETGSNSRNQVINRFRGWGGITGFEAGVGRGDRHYPKSNISRFQISKNWHLSLYGPFDS